MKKFVIKTVLYIIPILFILFLLEIHLRHSNAFWQKANYIENKKDSIEIMVLGSSHTYYSINPIYFDFNAISLAIEGGAFNLDYMLFKNYIDKLSGLKAIIIEASCHSFEEKRGENWGKNHLFKIFYDINPNNKDIALQDHFLITSNFKLYSEFLFSTKPSFPEFRKFDKLGTYIPDDTATISTKGYSMEFLKKRHNKKNVQVYDQYNKYLDDIINVCSEKGIKIIFLSTPKFHTYNEFNVKDKLNRRDSLVEKYCKKEGVFFLNYERYFELEDKLFTNEDHVNVVGAKVFSEEVNDDLRKILLN